MSEQEQVEAIENQEEEVEEIIDAEGEVGEEEEVKGNIIRNSVLYGDFEDILDFSDILTIEVSPENNGEDVVQPEGEEDKEKEENAVEGEEAKEGEEDAKDGEGEGEQYDPDERSVYVKNVDYGADPDTLKEHFQD